MKFNVVKFHSMRVQLPDNHLKFDYSLHQQKLEQVQHTCDTTRQIVKLPIFKPLSRHQDIDAKKTDKKKNPNAFFFPDQSFYIISLKKIVYKIVYGTRRYPQLKIQKD